MPPPRSIAIMWGVAAATLPVLATSAFFYGAGVWLNLAAALAAATAAELLCLHLRRQPLAAAADGSAAVCACILAVALPPAAAWFVAASASASAITLAKHCYGGLGNNPFNPAMVGYALVFLAFPQHFADWSSADATSHPTPLAAARLDAADASIEAAPHGPIALASAVAGGALLAARLADWRLTAAFALGAAAVHAALGGAWQMLAHGGLVFAAFFVITDPVTAAATRRGRWLYGAAVGALAVWLRARGAHTDSIAFAVLIGNLLAPLCDLISDKLPPRWPRR